MATPNPAAGASYDEWLFERPSGFPVAADSAQVVESASASVAQGWPHTITATVTLAEVPDADTDAALVLAFGHEAGGTCTPASEIATSTFQPAPTGTRDGRIITLHGSTGGQADTWDCSVLTLSEAAQVVDRLNGAVDVTRIVDYTTEVGVKRVSRERVRPQRWSTVRIEVKNTSDLVPLSRVKILGQESPDVRMRAVVLRDGLEPGESAVVSVPVLLEVNGARTLELRVKPTSPHAIPLDVYKKIRLRPRR